MATGNSIKAPPVLNEVDDYLNWKNDIEVWQIFADTKPEKQGPTVYLTLTGRARDAVRELKPVDIGKADGLETIIRKLDAVFLKDKNTRAYVAFKEFYSYKRRPGDTFTMTL